MVTPQTYTDTPEMHGNYAKTTLSELMTKMELLAMDDDSYLKRIRRSQILLHLKMAIREISRQVGAKSPSIEFELPPTRVWIVPQSYKQWTEISVGIYNDMLGRYDFKPLDESRNMSIATGILQGSAYEILYDNLGNILTADSGNAYSIPHQTVQESHDMPSVSKYGEFVVDEDRGVIIFSSELAGRLIQVKYISDGLEEELTESEVTIHKDLENVIIALTYYSCIQWKRTVPANEKRGALDRYKSILHEAKITFMNLDMKAVRRAILL